MKLSPIFFMIHSGYPQAQSFSVFDSKFLKIKIKEKGKTQREYKSSSPISASWESSFKADRQQHAVKVERARGKFSRSCVRHARNTSKYNWPFTSPVTKGIWCAACASPTSNYPPHFAISVGMLDLYTFEDMEIFYVSFVCRKGDDVWLIGIHCFLSVFRFIYAEGQCVNFPTKFSVD